MKTFILRLIVTSVSLLPIFCDQIRQTTSAGDWSPQSYSEFGKHNITLAINSSIRMACTKEANLFKSIVWWFNGSSLAGAGPTPTGLGYYNINVSTSNTTSTLFINAMQSNNTGLYRCSVGNTTPLQHYLRVEDPTLRISCQNTDCSSSLEANLSQLYRVQCYINQNPLYEPVTWKINNVTSFDQIEPNNSMNNVYDNMYLASTLLYIAKKDHTMITCSMGVHSTNVTVKVIYEEENILPVIILAVGILAVVVIICTLMAIVYCCWAKKEYPSRQNSVLSVVNVSYENGRAEQFDTHPDVSQSSDDGPTLTPVNDKWKRLCERNNQWYGLKLLSCRYDDKVDVFSEAVFVDGDYKDRFVVKSVSGKSTIESLEDFRKFQMRLTELATHPNVLEVLGCYTNKLPYRICYEYFPNKTVRDYLFEDFQNLQNSKMHDMQAQKLFCIAQGVADGIFYLKANDLDHVALRGEKVLYFGATICKLYDFSLRHQSERKAKNLLEKSEYLAWLGPDILLRNKYNHLTDIWAFGVFMWELWSGGQMPFEKSPRLTLEMNMRNENMLQQPANCPGVIYSLMLSCWKMQPSERRSYRDIVTELENTKTSICKNVLEDYDVSLIPGPSFYTSLDETTYDHLATL